MSFRRLQDTFTIELTKGQQALVDERDWYSLRRYSWCADKVSNGDGYYAVRGIPHPEGEGRRTTTSMHRDVMGLEWGDSQYVDHINHNKLDNRRENLRIVTHLENSENREQGSAHGPGVQFCPDGKRIKRYKASILYKGKREYLGRYVTPEEAREARERFKKEHNL